MRFRSTLLVFLAASVIWNEAAAGRKKSSEVASRESRSASASGSNEKKRDMSVSVEISEEKRRESRSDSGSKSRSASRSVSVSVEMHRFAPFRYYLEQSPIHIKSKSKSVGFDRLLKPLNFNYKSANEYTLKNIGNDFIVKFPDGFESSVSGGPLDQPYFLSYMQIRWGKKNWRGSEHLVNGRGYAAEVQFVHFNRAKYGTFDEASKHGDGLAVVSVFLDLAHKTNHAVLLVSKLLRKIPKRHMKISSHYTLPLNDLLPKNQQKFWTYSGSLTRRPFTENAVWIVLRSPAQFSKKELYNLRRFRPSNRRRLQPLNDRVIRASFHKRGKAPQW